MMGTERSPRGEGHREVDVRGTERSTVPVDVTGTERCPHFTPVESRERREERRESSGAAGGAFSRALCAHMIRVGRESVLSRS